MSSTHGRCLGWYERHSFFEDLINLSEQLETRLAVFRGEIRKMACARVVGNYKLKEKDRVRRMDILQKNRNYIYPGDVVSPLVPSFELHD